MLAVTIGFNHGPDDARFEVGQVLEEDFADKATVEYLSSRGALTPVTEATPGGGELTEPAPSPNPPKKKKSASRAHSASKGES